MRFIRSRCHKNCYRLESTDDINVYGSLGVRITGDYGLAQGLDRETVTVKHGFFQLTGGCRMSWHISEESTDLQKDVQESMNL